MSRLWRLWLILIVIASAAAIARADDAAPADANKLCPVMTDQPTKSSRFLDYDGKRIYFCCEKCIAKFQKEPERYLINLTGRAPATAPVARSASGTRLASPSWQLFGKLHVAIV